SQERNGAGYARSDQFNLLDLGAVPQAAPGSNGEVAHDAGVRKSRGDQIVRAYVEGLDDLTGVRIEHGDGVGKILGNNEPVLALWVTRQRQSGRIGNGSIRPGLLQTGGDFFPRS